MLISLAMRRPIIVLEGRTNDRAYVLHGKRMAKEMFYVGLTRHVDQVYY